MANNQTVTSEEIRKPLTSRHQRVRVTVRDGVTSDRSFYEDFWTHEKTPGVAAHDLIASLCLRDGDTLEISFLGDVP